MSKKKLPQAPEVDETDETEDPEEITGDPVAEVEQHYFRHLATQAVHAVDKTWAAVFNSRKTLVRISKEEYDDETSDPV